MSYKTLGNYIQPVNIRNKELEVTTLLGVSIKKVLMPSIANTIGTNMKTYKIIKQNQFAYGPVTSRNGDKISIALLEEYETAIVSQAYTVFEVIDKTELLPEYLMMWFRRPEFDRYARYKSHGSARETFDWDELCETQLPIPSLEKQQQIVDEYNTVTNRIKLNEQINTNLEATAQALYKHWFVDFEFPIDKELALKIGNPDLEGKPYKSSGGEMVYNEELDKDIPVGWSVERFDEIYKIKAGGDKPKNASLNKTGSNQIPIYANGVTDEGLVGYSNKATILNKSITISARGTIGFAFLRLHPFIPIVRLITLIPYDEDYLYYLYQNCINYDFTSSGSVQSQLTKPNISLMKKLIPSKKTIIKYNVISEKLLERRLKNNKETKQLQKLQSLLLAKMTKVEVEKTVEV